MLFASMIDLFGRILMGHRFPIRHGLLVNQKNVSGFDCAQMDVQTGNWYASDCSLTILPLVCTLPTNTTLFSPTPPPTTTTKPPFSPKHCAACYPGADNILFLLDVSEHNVYWNNLVKALIETAGNWSAFERIAILGYAEVILDECLYNVLRDLNEMENVLGYMTPRSSYFPSIAGALYQAPLVAPLDFSYTGNQTTILISSVGDDQDITNAIPYAKQLQDMGSLIVISLNYKVDSLSRLASPGMALDWSNTFDVKTLRDFLDGLLNK